MSLLVLSNGHGEDAIACRILDRLTPAGAAIPSVDAWPIVGDGRLLRARGLRCVGEPNRLPSGGIATLSIRWAIRDLRAGWLQVHVRQLRAAAALRGRYRLALAIGDIVPLVFAVAARVPFLFVSSAKTVRSRFPHRPNGLEVFLMRRAIEVYPRDEATTTWLRARAVPATFVGNPMMDDLEPTQSLDEAGGADTVIAALPGSRSDATANILTIASVAAELGTLLGRPERVAVRCAAVPGIGVQAIARSLLEEVRPVWHQDPVTHPSPDRAGSPILSLRHESGLAFGVWVDRFAEIVHRADVVIGLAGTANEQAVGLGKPVVTFPTAGPFDESYVRMKVAMMGDAVLPVRNHPPEVARTIGALLADPDRRARMADAGRLLMGRPGASAVIAAAIATRLEETRP